MGLIASDGRLGVQGSARGAVRQARKRFLRAEMSCGFKGEGGIYTPMGRYRFSPKLAAELRLSGRKWCGKCGTVKPLGEFRNCKSASDGKAGRCAACQRADKAAWRKTEHAKALVREQQKRYRARHPDVKSGYEQDWSARNPGKRAAYSRGAYERLTDAVVANRLGVRVGDAPSELIEAARAFYSVNRALKEKR